MPANLRGWEILVIAALVLLLFGAKRLPDAARGLGRSLRIFKAETKGLHDGPEIEAIEKSEVDAPSAEKSEEDAPSAEKSES